MLLDRAWREDEELIAAGAVARATRRIFRNWGCALALGRWRAADCQGRLRLPLPITPTLPLPTLFAVGAGAITAGSAPTAPVPGRLLTGRTAIARLRPRRPKPTLTALQQTAAAAERLRAGVTQEALTRTVVVGKVKGAHGR